MNFKFLLLISIAFGGYSSLCSAGGPASEEDGAGSARTPSPPPSYAEATGSTAPLTYAEATKRTASALPSESEETPVQKVERLTPLAKAGDVEAQLALGCLLLKREGFPDSDKQLVKEGLSWLRKSYEGGNLDACYHLARVQWEAKNPKVKNPSQAFEMMNKVIAGGKPHPLASFCLYEMHKRGEGTPCNLVEARLHLLTAAKGGHPHAQFQLHLNYLNGEEGLTKDLKKAAEWLVAAAEAGHPKAQFRLHLNWLKGVQGFQQNREKAEHWRQAAILSYEELAGQGDPSAQKALDFLKNPHTLQPAASAGPQAHPSASGLRRRGNAPAS